MALTMCSLSSMPGTAVSLLPRPTNTGFINGSDEWHYQYGNGTRLDCITYVNGSDFGSSASCADVAKDAGVNATDIAESVRRSLHVGWETYVLRTASETRFHVGRDRILQP